MTERLHQVLGLAATSDAVQSVTLDKPVLGVKSGYLISGNAASYVTTPTMPEAIDLAVVTDTPNADGEIRLTAPTTLQIYLETHTPEAADVMVLEVVDKASVPQP
ncbi:hypothetical protein LCGC14_1432320 [marine sediment metagenome]|uniref:Uncharacterized protein n=1 Tax=marine sediment metagenome TaxID=412755 RepID=A0A0F9K9F4_9ZZZZ